MGRLLDLVKGVETSLHSRLGVWMCEASRVGDTLTDQVAYLVTVASLFGQSFLLQDTWYVDSVGGDDANDGLTLGTAIKTLGELTRRWSGRAYDPSVTAINIYLYGAFLLDSLVLNATVTVPTTISVYGRTTQVDVGSVTAYQAWDSANDLRATLTDATQNFTAHVRRRIRLTSGTGAGAITWIGSLGGGATVANIGQFRTTTWPTGVKKNPAPGDAYVIEMLDTPLLEYRQECEGPVTVDLHDLSFTTTQLFGVLGGVSRCVSSTSGGPAWMRSLGCSFTVAAGSDFAFMGDHFHISCGYFGPAASNLGLYFNRGYYNIKSACCFTSLHLYFSADFTLDSPMHDGNGTHWVGTAIQEGSKYRVFDTFDAYFGCIAGPDPNCLVRVSNMSQYIMSNAYFWGAAGNQTLVALNVANGNGAYYAPGMKPKATGATPGNDVLLADTQTFAWANIPAIAAGINNAAVLEK